MNLLLVMKTTQTFARPPWLMPSIRWRFSVIVLVLFMGLVPLSAVSQIYTDNGSYIDNKPGTHAVTNEIASGVGSDYQAKFTWSGILGASDASWFNPCNCDDVGLQQVQYGATVNNVRSPYSSPVLSFGSDGGSQLTTSTKVLGPGYNRGLYSWIRIDGQDPNTAFAPCGSECENYGWGIYLNIRTASLKKPASLAASDNEAAGSELKKIKLTWTKGTDVPDADIGYKVYRKLASQGNSSYALKATLSTAVLTWTDTDANLSAATTYTYKVTTYLNSTGSGKWGAQESSSGATDNGTTLDPLVEATDGVYKNRIKISWVSLAGVVDNIRVERSETNSTTVFEELDILNKNATSYNDYDPIPGAKYTYRITFLDANGNDIQGFADLGHMKPNGVIRGRVISNGGAGVSNVAITVTATGSLTGAKTPAIGVSTGPYTQVTDVGGYYEIRDIYYYDSATFEIQPALTGHEFDPDSLVRIVDLNGPTQSNVDFLDLTALTVAGQVSFPIPALFGGTGTGIPVEGATILIDNTDFGIRTKSNGSWSYALTDSNTYVFKSRYKHHSFDQDSIVLNVGGDITNINFINTQEDSIEVRIQGGCNSFASTDSLSLKVQVTSTEGNALFDGIFNTNDNGYLMLPLPAAEFNVKVKDSPNLNPNAWAQFMDTTIRLDLSLRDSAEVIVNDSIVTVTPPTTVILGGDTTIIPGTTTTTTSTDTLTQSSQPSADFIFYRPFVVTVGFDDAGAEILANCLNTLPGNITENIILFEQGVKYVLPINVVEQGTQCPVEEGTVKIYDFIGDREQTPVNIPIVNGNAFYELTAGLPNLASGSNHPNQKLLYLIITAGVRDPQPEDYWGLVQGAASLAPTFATRSPEIPDLVLHDPPGDASYAMVEAGSTWSSFQTTEYENSGAGGIYSDLIFGTTIITPFSKNALGIQWKFELEAGRENFDRTGYTNNLTFTDAYSTSDDAIFTGYDGDVYIGKATNQQFAIAKVLTYDSTTCVATVSDEPSLQVTGIATTFIYTEKHIRDILIPQLGFLENALRINASSLATADSLVNIHEADSFLIDILNWTNILAQNDSNRNEKAEFVENLSFSAGAAFDRTEEQDSTWGGSYEYVNFVDISTSLGGRIKAESGGWTDNAVGIAGRFRHAYTQEDGNDTTLARTVSFHLEDDDFGDFFSVDILRDKTYDVPAFRIFSGTSSCPREPGTQPRDSADIVITPPQLDNVPIGGQAVFTALLTNYSNSQETREYHVRVVSTTNPDGAVIKLNGQLINHREASFFIDAFQTATTYLTVEQGPLASNYTNIGIMMYPPCEYELWQNNGAITSGDTAWITVNFETECSNVALINPGNNWLVNQNDNDILTVDFSGYDLNNPYLESLTLQYKERGGGWIDGPTILADSIPDAIYRIPFDVSGLFDGRYSLRAKASCSSGRGVTYSSEVDGVIDRSSIAPFGIPSPSDGFLRLGQEISITFDKDIKCNFAAYNTDSMSLVRVDNRQAIPFTAQCSGDKIILAPDMDLFADTTLIGVELEAYVGGIEDLAGNVQEYPAQWVFQINVSPVFWDPEVLERSAFVGTIPVIQSILKNAAVISKSFILTDYPVWLTPENLSGTVLSNGEYVLNFTVDPGLDPGIYSGIVTATVDDTELDLSITFKMLATPPNWVVDVSNFDYSMTVIAQFSLDNGNTQLATDTRDLIVAFVDGQPRGVGQIQYINDIDQYAAFVTIYSNNSGGGGGETVKFRFWHAVKGIEYGAVETATFVNDATLGSISSPFMLHPDGIVQEIPLKKGWNWISLNVANGDMSREGLLESILSPEIGNDILIKRKDGKSSDYNENSGWSGNLKFLDNDQGYMIHLSNQADTLRVVGTPVTPSAISLGSGWSWLGYQPQSIKTTNEALLSLSATTGDILKSQFEFVEYFGTTGNWIGSLKFMKPGLGYKVNLDNSGNLTYPARTASEDYQVVHEDFESNMTVIATISFEGMSWVDENRFLVGAFIDDTCRGVGALEYVEKLQAYRIYLPVHGDATTQGRQIEFRLYDLQEEMEFIADNQETFEVDKILGHVLDPYVLFENLAIDAGFYLLQNNPNPFSTQTVISYLIPNDSHVRLMVYDQQGRPLAVLVDEMTNAGVHEVGFKVGKLPEGVYLYRLEAGNFSASRKMIITGN